MNISLILCTVRADDAYITHPEWNCVGKIIDDLTNQTFPLNRFELIVVDGLYGRRQQLPAPFQVKYVEPRQTAAVRCRKVDIPAYRNTGIAHACGELCLNLDDCVELPKQYLEVIWHAWSKHKVCLSPLWPESGDSRPQGRVGEIIADGETRPHPLVYGFGSYPLRVALYLNGYDEAYSAAQGLEDADWSVRLRHANVQQGLLHIPGFKIHPQSRHDGRVIDLERPVVRCCNLAWQVCRVQNHVLQANKAAFWTPARLQYLLGPCALLNADETCQHHHGQHRCAFIDHGFAKARDPEAAEILKHPPVLNLHEEWGKCHA